MGVLFVVFPPLPLLLLLHVGAATAKETAFTVARMAQLFLISLKNKSKYLSVSEELKWYSFVVASPILSMSI